MKRNKTELVQNLTEEQVRIRDDFMIYWHTVLPKKYSIIEKFNHISGLKPLTIEAGKVIDTLEIGAGLGEHIKHEDLTFQKYYALEIRQDMAEKIKQKFPSVNVHQGDIQKRTPFADRQFDRIVAVHVLEHIPALEFALGEMKRILKDDGFCDIVIPCEGSLAYSLARKLSAQRIFEKRYKMSYKWLIESEHVNNYYEIKDLLREYFSIEWSKFFPFPVSLVFCNLALGLRCRKK
jgi:SAM-dependent methyltransferase